jgi:hypothetical protein
LHVLSPANTIIKGGSPLKTYPWRHIGKARERVTRNGELQQRWHYWRSADSPANAFKTVQKSVKVREALGVKKKKKKRKNDS